jgi:hypothetical protein
MIAIVVDGDGDGGVVGDVGDFGDLEPHAALSAAAIAISTAATGGRPLMTAIMSQPCRYN